ncbi:MAG: LysR family transcriptional regulator [Kordiimonadaceae bacterium]|jgi:DNA-binding transcriptional LysR family regulator|nr:LysR family transcriptional regulator [Kordiimonadaceae bacterium]MBT6032969.1 LysR family transcriptional regulator [Kordiimonadaceae bacterium]
MIYNGYMRLRQIEIFNAVYSCGSISGAARQLNIAQPTASKILKHAEDQLGFLLFRRVRGRLIATSEAKILFKETEIIYKQITKLKSTSENLKNPSDGKIRLVSVAALSIEILPKLIQKYRSENPKAQFIYQTDHFNHMISTLHEYDKEIGFALNPPKVEGITETIIGESEMVCIYGNGEFDHHPGRLKLNDLSGFDYVSIEDSGPLSELLDQHLSHESISYQSKIIAQTYFVARSLVALGSGVAIVDKCTAASQKPENIQIKGFNPPIKFTVKALHVAERPLSKSSLDFLSFIKNNIEL